ncbi:ABC transporter ATP-binding protein [Tetragenococcus halophilus]|uniref:ABC transporter ATP-binding protein n=1 Tax=Tetragenococcus halophilus TaxID=51669 RepID=UPI001F26A4B5|nr:ABC transporter ATP-binding protein [Tetragenococcus halophilus]MCF1684572.1 ABC transporter ATP-binding protein [Tetragenococcus halophilus]
MKEVIRIADLSKKYGKNTVVDNVNLSIQQGEIFGFLGLNGAGKTTTIKTLLGMVKPTKGECFIQGTKINKRNTEIWQDVGYIVETPYSYPELTVRENLEIVRQLREIKDKYRIDWIIKKLRLKEHEAKKAKHLSQGNNQRLGIAKAMIHKPQVLILDEPTNGLDPAGVVEVRQLLIELAEKFGVTILISSHKLEEISKMATNIAIIHYGQLTKKISNKQLEQQLRKSLILNGPFKKEMRSVLSQSGYDVKVLEEGLNDLQITNEDAISNPEKVVTILVKAGYPPNLLKVEKEDLEMFFLRTIKEKENT